MSGGGFARCWCRYTSGGESLRARTHLVRCNPFLTRYACPLPLPALPLRPASPLLSLRFLMGAGCARIYGRTDLETDFGTDIGTNL